MIFYDYCRSSAAFRVRIALELKGLEVERRSINLRTVEHRGEEYTKINEQRLVPALVDGDVRIAQSLVIIEYLDSIAPDPILIPREGDKRLDVMSFALAISSDIHPLNNLRVLNTLKTNLEVEPDQLSQWYSYWVQEGFHGLEATANQKGNGKFCIGDSVSLADVFLVPQIYNAKRFEVDLSAFPTLLAVNDALMQIEAFQAAVPERQPDFEN